MKAINNAKSGCEKQCAPNNLMPDFTLRLNCCVPDNLPPNRGDGGVTPPPSNQLFLNNGEPLFLNNGEPIFLNP